MNVVRMIEIFSYKRTERPLTGWLLRSNLIEVYEKYGHLRHLPLLV